MLFKNDTLDSLRGVKQKWSGSKQSIGSINQKQCVRSLYVTSHALSANMKEEPFVLEKVAESVIKLSYGTKIEKRAEAVYEVCIFGLHCSTSRSAVNRGAIW